MTMLDSRNQPTPGSSDFGNWQRPAVIGLFGMNPVISFGGLILVLGAGGIMMFTHNFFDLLIYLLLVAVFYAPLAIKIEGKSVFARMVRRLSYRRARRRRETAYLGGPLSPQPHGRFRLPGLLAATRMYSAQDAYGERFAFLRVPLTNSYPVIVRANADGDALVDPATIDTMIGTWSGFLQTTPQWPDLKAFSVTIESVPDPGNKISAEIDRTRTEAQVSQFTEQVFKELRDASGVGSAAQHTWMSLVFDGGKGKDKRGVEDMATEIGTQLPDIIGALAGTGAGAASAMTPSQVAETAWAAFHPAEAGDLDDAPGELELDWESAGPSSAQELWDRYRHDSGISVSWVMEGAPRGAVKETVLKRLLEPHPHLPRKRVTIYYRPLDPAAAAGWADRQRNVIATSSGGRAAVKETSSSAAAANARDEARGASVLRFAVVTTITVTDEDQLRRAVKAVRNLHAGARLVMSRAYGQQAAAFSAGLGLGVLLPDHVTLPKVLTE
ncbi:hypothetical protein SAMN05892883_2243 [Jatrophihabitans sp. GAS493]|uniref:SCO6880 family protein n=1 Tax=Jatrophihabitans sp. GAS493 TaxID=1907575 RepID=UPI000BB688EF|nr:SCO6880 family protein [Jatrophihabitans sp. GAS493]SOD72929.1 hypothetical protein SAMN05892883_2243 [Jatrophihabitans sp. GAS493]